MPRLIDNDKMLVHAFVLIALHKEVKNAEVLSFKSDLVVNYSLAFISALSPLLTIVLRKLNILG